MTVWAIASRVVKLMIKKGVIVNGARLLMLGITFKENCPDVRNTKLIVDAHSGLTVTAFKSRFMIQRQTLLRSLGEYNLTTPKALPSERFDAGDFGWHILFCRFGFFFLAMKKSKR
jgi:UDP-N-acetyl-D-galactosamine dehydrogenase